MGVKADFVKFLNQGNFVTLAVAFVVATALNAVVQALVADIITPMIGVVLKVNFATWTYTLNGSTFMQGDLVNKLIGFLIDIVVVFFAIVEPMEKYQARQAAKAAAAPPTTRACPECQSQVPIAATRCAFCTQPLPPVAPETTPAAATPAK
jgi:large conductance mechanosensitive channel